LSSTTTRQLSTVLSSVRPTVLSTVLSTALSTVERPPKQTNIPTIYEWHGRTATKTNKHTNYLGMAPGSLSSTTTRQLSTVLSTAVSTARQRQHPAGRDVSIRGLSAGQLCGGDSMVAASAVQSSAVQISAVQCSEVARLHDRAVTQWSLAGAKQTGP
jgi:hypothetical protein